MVWMDASVWGPGERSGSTAAAGTSLKAGLEASTDVKPSSVARGADGASAYPSHGAAGLGRGASVCSLVPLDEEVTGFRAWAAFLQRHGNSAKMGLSEKSVEGLGARRREANRSVTNAV